MTILGAIIAGGRSSRMGGREKAFIDFDGRPLIVHVRDRLAPQVAAIVINANGDPARFHSLGHAVIADKPGDMTTPLAGLRVVLTHAQDQGFTEVLSVPSDTPFLPNDLAGRLAKVGAPAVAASGGHTHFLTGLWPVSALDLLEGGRNREMLQRVQDFASLVGARPVSWPDAPVDPFLNLNTPEELRWAEASAALDGNL